MDHPSVIIERMLHLGNYQKQESLALTLEISPGTLSDYKNKRFMQHHLIERFLKKHPEVDEIELCYGRYCSGVHSKKKEQILNTILQKATDLERLHNEALNIYKQQSKLLNEILEYKK